MLVCMGSSIGLLQPLCMVNVAAKHIARSILHFPCLLLISWHRTFSKPNFTVFFNFFLFHCFTYCLLAADWMFGICVCFFLASFFPSFTLRLFLNLLCWAATVCLYLSFYCYGFRWGLAFFSGFDALLALSGSFDSFCLFSLFAPFHVSSFENEILILKQFLLLLTV